RRDAGGDDGVAGRNDRSRGGSDGLAAFIRRDGLIIDSHGHVTAPDSLYVYKAQILAHRGAHGRGGNLANDEDVKKALNAPVFGGSSHLAQLKEVGTDLQLISPRPYQMMTSEHPRLVQWFVEETNNIIAK